VLRNKLSKSKVLIFFQRFSVLDNMFRPTWPLSSNTTMNEMLGRKLSV